jgi:hypothetical protein
VQEGVAPDREQDAASFPADGCRFDAPQGRGAFHSRRASECGEVVDADELKGRGMHGVFVEAFPDV